VGPGVRAKLVALSIDLLDLRLIVIDAGPIQAVDEEGSLGTGVVEGIADVDHVVIWPVIEGKCDRVGHRAGVEGRSGTLEKSR